MFSHPCCRARVGVARVDITPPKGIYCRNWGAARHDTATAIHRSLQLTALVISTDVQSQPLVLVDADLGWWADLRLEREFRRRVSSAIGVPDARFLFALTHTHSAPPLCRPEPHWVGGQLLAEYLDSLAPATIAAIRTALSHAQPATIEWQYGKCDLAANRDMPDRQPRAVQRIVCGYHPEGTADDTLAVGRVTADTGTVLATITNYACHPTTLAWDNTSVSPDYVGAFRETVEAGSSAAPAIFLQGASGELAPRYQYVGDPEVADQHGRQLGHAVLATLASMEPAGHMLAYDRVVESGAPLAVWSRQPSPAANGPAARLLEARCESVHLPVKNWPTADELVRQYQQCDDRALAERLRRKLRIRQAIGDGDTFPLDLWGWRLGQSLVLGTMAEAYSSVQQTLRAELTGSCVVWLNLVNGSVGYLPPQALYDVDIYQVWQTPFDRGSLELVTDAAVRLARQLIS